MPDKTTCSVDGCERNALCRGWCSSHYARWRAHPENSPTGLIRSHDPAERLWARVVKGPRCWIWQGRPNTSGYGQMLVDGKLTLVHRFSYELFRGPIPDNLGLDHLCRVPMCVNHEHLQPVTNRVNVVRGVSPNGINAKKTHCLRGHALSGDNLGWKKGKYGETRYCKTCKKTQMADWQRAHPQKVAAYQRALRERRATDFGHKTLQTAPPSCFG